MKLLTVVTYHHVRDSEKNRFPKLEAIGTSAFREQLKYFKKHYQIISLEECVAAVYDKKPLARNALLLTFDNGYQDHFTHAYPILQELGLSAAFFLCGRAVEKRELLDSDKVNLIVACAPSPALLGAGLQKALMNFHSEFGEIDESQLGEVPSGLRFDDEVVLRVKQVLQRAYPPEYRNALVDELFKNFVHEDPQIVGREYYMTADQIRCLKRQGMAIGAQGWNHSWWDLLSEAEQIREIDLSAEFLRRFQPEPGSWTLAYPFGVSTPESENLLRERGCQMAFTKRSKVAELEPSFAFKVARFGSHDFPVDSNAGANVFTKAVLD